MNQISSFQYILHFRYGLSLYISNCHYGVMCVYEWHLLRLFCSSTMEAGTDVADADDESTCTWQHHDKLTWSHDDSNNINKFQWSKQVNKQTIIIKNSQAMKLPSCSLQLCTGLQNSHQWSMSNENIHNEERTETMKIYYIYHHQYTQSIYSKIIL